MPKPNTLPRSYWESPAGGGVATATAYLREFAPVFDISPQQLERAGVRVDFLEPRQQEAEYRLCEEKRQFDSETFGFCQTYLNVPVWRAGLKVVVKQGMALAITGVAIGLGASYALTRLMKTLLFGVSATDPLTFTVIALMLAIVALTACWIPARRAAKVDPMVALRTE